MTHKTEQPRHRGAGGLERGCGLSPQHRFPEQTQSQALCSRPSPPAPRAACGQCLWGKERQALIGHTGVALREGPPQYGTLVWEHRRHCGTSSSERTELVNDVRFFSKLKQRPGEWHRDLMLTPVSWCVFLSRRGSITAAPTLGIPRGAAQVCVSPRVPPS